MEGIIELTLWQVAAAYLFVVIVLLIVKSRGIKKEGEIVLSSVRMTLQLILAGYVLVYVLDNPNPFITVAIVILMEAFAIYTVMAKFKGLLTGKLKKIISLSMGIGAGACLLYLILAVIGVQPWYDPQYFIPIAGMVVGNSMTGVSLAVKSLLEGMTTRRQIVEEALILGATPREATADIINRTFDSAIMPTINSMLGMGIIFLPGMMTGQILAGVSPTTAIAYQIAIMLGILGAVAVSVILTLQMGYRTFFNREEQLV
ncbi:MAG: iron export ABC transporter permease subunit FetB [Dehalococcoidales bacterium]|nr:iron export ABC transporter permease subunit FetB [Dehalococcoidales bacterium]MDD3264567.1 iron export ABC transporter permease subunit FetB [Dehalococcoidales bacterium]MDD4322468.1 iron export ABC transporter permease subunit FetB [Dehalococcoidales bacterium]MDD4794802.1 iron export ABC transporter permease subunit FetB [Dehalococcoidales bacterium]MDD5122222.1 iron export ABC transporter permease subunit FetB [Dehalococcoidales bacterium]